MKTMIVQIAGNNGCGKTYWTRKVFNATRILEPYKENERKMPIGYYGINNGKRILIAGRYEKGSPGGDSVRPPSKIKQVIDRYLSKCDIVLFEGLMLSHNWRILVDYKQAGYETCCIFIDENPEDCIKNVEARRRKPLTESQKKRIADRYSALKACNYKRKQNGIACIETKSNLVGSILCRIGLKIA